MELTKAKGRFVCHGLPVLFLRSNTNMPLSYYNGKESTSCAKPVVVKSVVNYTASHRKVVRAE